ncbi:CBASS cGAMP-activated phospholipase [Arcicella rigui]|uniref:CBASS cGAMP-activated phospholipase n=1 Tax=Arcicella rigui TaxID=797020 RepID=A0ABU5QAT9_9BACT|nr:CBASS cGAMP-activated phospholipase [Arcicella rigui]MEA5139968.1 CBASS cGAMP-activated phospholipase [Arcicella rigui]
MTEKRFKILSIDGGGIRGIFPAMFLAEFEAKLQAEGNPNWQVYQNFDLICGTSTGGIMAIALSLGIPAREVYNLYYDNAKTIFGNRKGFWKSIFKSNHERDALENLIRTKFQEVHNGENGKDPRLTHCKIPTCVPIYDLQEGCPSVLKSKYHPKFVRDYHIPAYQAALATSAAPTFFNPYSSYYEDLHGLKKPFHNKVDGGVFCNNPTLTAIVEAQKSFNKDLKDLSVLSIGTGHQKFCDAGITDNKQRENWGIIYWMFSGGKKRLIELFMQGQSQQVQNLISLLQNGVDKQETSNFIYHRIDTELDSTCDIQLDETNQFKLDKLAEKASREFQKNASVILQSFSK